MECYYQGRWDIHMISDYCWSLVRDKPQAPHKRKALKRQFAPITSCYTEIQSWKSKLFKSKDESISIIHTKSKELSIVDTRNKKQRIRHRLPKNFCWYFCIDYLNLCRNANKNFYSIFHKNALKVLLYWSLNETCERKPTIPYYKGYKKYTFRESYVEQYSISDRGGVEDTRLEAKAKDTKKIRGQGQGQPFRGQILSRPRTGMLEAKDQGYKRKCSPKKKKKVFTKIFQAISKKKKKKRSFTKIFQAISTKKRFPKNFSNAPQNFNNSKKYCCPRAEDRPIFEDLRPRGQGQGLDLRGQGLQNVSSRTPPLISETKRCKLKQT